MRRRFRLALQLLLGLALATLAQAARAAPALRPTVVLISLDGTTPGEVHRLALPTLEKLAARGVAATRMTPVFPANTFPNHVTLVTGVEPERHGIVNNVFFDPERGFFHYSSDPSWIEVEPIWSLLARHGVASAAFHWVGSEGPWHSGFGPRYWRRFEGTVPESKKVAQILAWLDLRDSAARPRLITCWFRGADGASHHYGPNSPQVARMLRGQDAALGRLVAGLESRHRFKTTTLIVVSDHGMATVHRRVDLQKALDDAKLRARVLGGGGFAMVRLVAGETRGERVVQVARRLGLEAWLRSDVPADLPADNPRFADVLVLAPVGTAIERGPTLAGPAGRGPGAREPLRGTHGYRPAEPAMGALFAAAGRGVRPGSHVETVRAVDIAPTILELLGVRPPPWMEGRPIPALLHGVAVPAPPDAPRPSGSGRGDS